MTIMCDKPHAWLETGRFDRRKLLGASATATAATLLGGTLDVGPAGAQALTQQERDQLTPDQILAEAKRGNDRIRTGQRASRDFLAEQKATASGGGRPELHGLAGIRRTSASATSSTAAWRATSKTTPRSSW
jgi:hypothetical protein